MPAKIYRLSLEWKPTNSNDESIDRFSLDARLDGVLFLDLVREWELGHMPGQEKDIAGSYAGLQMWNVGSLYQWLNAPPPNYDCAEKDEHKAVLLGCSCGVLDCWPLESDITMTDQQVIWSNFRQPFRKETWSYDSFGPFTFHRTQYEAEVRHAIANAPA